jgi:murein DD-endopeptidase MepM/ murein hydrolase activator NlpD
MAYSGFGFRRVRMHNGIDIVNRPGTEVKVIAYGVVVFAGIKSGYGNLVIVYHGYDTFMLYGYLSSIGVNEEDRVKRGEFVGEMGNIGYTTEPHLHYEVRVNGVPVNSARY